MPKEIAKKIIKNNYEISKDEALNLLNAPVDLLLNLANDIRKHFCKDSFDFCTIINVKSGNCSEDCKYCAQSARFNTGCDVYEILDQEKILKIADDNKLANRIALVSSGRGLKKNSKEFNKVKKAYEALKNSVDLNLCASFGIADDESLKMLKESGVSMYHHNLETSKNYFSQICSTHSFEERVDTILRAKKIGFKICSGGIFGMGESFEDRIDLAFALKNLGVVSVPINILTPIRGTPLESKTLIDKIELLKTIAIYRFILPNAFLRFAGGRMQILDIVQKALNGGINSLLSGNYLTTTGSNLKDDIKMAKDNGFKI